MTIWTTRITCSLPKSTNTHSDYVILTAFALQQWLKERNTMICYTYTECLVWYGIMYTTSPEADKYDFYSTFFTKSRYRYRCDSECTFRAIRRT